MINDILVNLPTNGSVVVRNYALSVANLFDAHLSGVALIRELPRWVVADGIDMTAIEEWCAERQVQTSRAVHSFEECMRLHGSRSDFKIISDRFGKPTELFAGDARNHDLSVMAQSQDVDDIDNDLLIEAALFDSGRPVLIVPCIQTEGIKLDRVMVCWDGSQNAARAVGDSIPILERARKVEVITVENKDRLLELRGAAVAEHLARYKIDVELKPVIAPDGDAANIILNEVAETAIDLIVMGAYGHTRFREFVLGGVTRSMLSAMTVPVLMSH